jgi:hypothetical protein
MYGGSRESGRTTLEAAETSSVLIIFFCTYKHLSFGFEDVVMDEFGKG